MGILQSSTNYTYTNGGSSSSSSSSDYVAPSYITSNANTDLTSTREDDYNEMVGYKNTFLGVLYSKIPGMFNGTTTSDIDDDADTAASTYVGQTGAYTVSSTNGYSTLLNTSAEVQKKRLKMDADISRLSSSRNLNNKNDPGVLYNAHFFVNILWVILATTLIYYIFTEL